MTISREETRKTVYKNFTTSFIHADEIIIKGTESNPIPELVPLPVLTVDNKVSHVRALNLLKALYKKDGKENIVIRKIETKETKYKISYEDFKKFGSIVSK